MYFNKIFPSKVIYQYPMCWCCGEEINEAVEPKCMWLNQDYIHKECFYDQVGQIEVEEGSDVVCSCCGRVINKVCDTYSVIEWQPVCQECVEKEYEIWTPMPSEI